MAIAFSFIVTSCHWKGEAGFTIFRLECPLSTHCGHCECEQAAGRIAAGIL
jgi:hypothetical protein